MAGQAPEDPDAGLAPEDRLLRKKLPALDLADPFEPEPAQLRERAMIADEAARAVPGVTNSEGGGAATGRRSEEHTSELQSLMRNSYAVFCLKKKTKE